MALHVLRVLVADRAVFRLDTVEARDAGGALVELIHVLVHIGVENVRGVQTLEVLLLLLRKIGRRRDVRCRLGSFLPYLPSVLLAAAPF